MNHAKKGAIQHDGWTCNGAHHIGLCAIHVRQGVELAKGRPQDVTSLAISLLSVALMAHAGDVEDHNKDTPTDDDLKFNAETHIRHFETIFHHCGADCHKWSVCNVGNDCSTNRRAADIADTPHVGCKNHKLNLEVNKMMREVPDTEEAVDKIHDIMKACKRRLKNAAALRNLTHLAPIMHNKTRWSGKLHMLERFLRLKPSLLAVADDVETPLEIDGHTWGLLFNWKALKCKKQLDNINAVTVLLQQRGLKLADGR
jgi:hypothetical protein